MLFNYFNYKNILDINYSYFEEETKALNIRYKSKYFHLEDMVYKLDPVSSEFEVEKNKLDNLAEVIYLINYQEEENIKDSENKLNEIDFFIKSRKHRDYVKHTFKMRKFLIGDILEFVYNYKSIILTFSGICICLRKKSFIMPELSLILRNVIIGIGVELTLSYFYHKVWHVQFLDYRRKFFNYNKNKLYFIRTRVNRESKV